MILASVVTRSGQTQTTLGEHGFLQLPQAGDELVLPSVSGGLDFVVVLFTEHTPVQPARPNRKPTATIVVKWLREEM